MKIIEDKHELQEELAEWRHAREHVAIVPTMGNLHAGHVSLVNVAKELAERVVVTVFVNPTQFDEGAMVPTITEVAMEATATVW